VRSTLEQIWVRSSVEGHVFTYDETFAWPKAERERVLALGLLRRVEDADWIECDACGEAHSEDVVFLDEEGLYPVIPCPVVGLVRISPERLQRWEVDFGVVAKLLAAAFGLTGTLQELKPGRVWLLGSRRLAGRLAEFFLVQGVDWADGPELLSSTPRLQNSPAPVVLFPSRLPEEPIWQSCGRALYSLRELVRLGESGLAARLDSLEDLYRQIALRLEEPIVPTPVKERPALVERFRERHTCRVKDVYTWAGVVREDFYRWQRGDPKVPDGGDKANRIERLLQHDRKTRS
jgi:hypothetical protein